MSVSAERTAGHVIDSSVVLAVLFQEPGGDVATSVLGDSAISTVNMSEVIAKMMEMGSTVEDAVGVIDEYGMLVVDFGVSQAIDCGLLRARTRALGLSLGDRACLALGRAMGAPVWTADRAWQNIDAGVEVKLIR